MRSIIAIALGELVALTVGLLVVFGILWPVFMTFFGMELTGSPVLPLALLVLSAAFAFYWGGMVAGYRAPSRSRLHGTLVAPVAFAVSPLFNILSGEPPFPAFVESSTTAALALLVLVVSTGACYLGGRRGEALYAHNRSVIQREERRRRAREARQHSSAGDSN